MTKQFGDWYVTDSNVNSASVCLCSWSPFSMAAHQSDLFPHSNKVMGYKLAGATSEKCVFCVKKCSDSPKKWDHPGKHSPNDTPRYVLLSLCKYVKWMEKLIILWHVWPKCTYAPHDVPMMEMASSKSSENHFRAQEFSIGFMLSESKCGHSNTWSFRQKTTACVIISLALPEDASFNRSEQLSWMIDQDHTITKQWG